MESMPCKITQITTCVIGGSIKLANMLCILSWFFWNPEKYFKKRFQFHSFEKKCDK